jgi:hypothetical protein
MKLSLLDVSAACRSRMECIEANTHDVQYENLSSLKATIDRIQSCVGWHEGMVRDWSADQGWQGSHSCC